MKRYPKLWTIMGWLVSALPCLAAQGTSVLNTVQNIQWTGANAALLRDALPNADAVAELENATAAPQDRNASPPDTVGSYEIVDLNHDGQLELVCTVDGSGRGFFTKLVVFYQKNGGTIARAEVSTNGASIGDLRSQIVDLNPSLNKSEILVPELLGLYEGHKRVATFTHVYVFGHNRLEQVDGDFRAYYTHTVLPRLRATLEQYKQRPAAADPAIESRRDREILTTQKEIDAITTRIGN